MATDWCPHVETMNTPQSRSKEFFRAASGQKIYNEGQTIVIRMTREGNRRDMKLTICDVAKALGSVSHMCRTGHKVIFNPPWDTEGSYIEHIEVWEKMWLQEQGGLYVLDARKVPKHKQTSTINHVGDQWDKDFHLQLQPEP